MKQKAFFIIFKGLLMEQITQIFSEGESPTLIFLTFLIFEMWKYGILGNRILSFLG